MEEKIQSQAEEPQNTSAPTASTEQQPEKESFRKLFTDGLVYSLLTIVRYIFVLPWDLWKRAVINMGEQRHKKALNIDGITGFWPFLTFLKRFFIDFLLDACSVLSWIITPIIGVTMAIVIGDFFIFVVSIFSAYYMPVEFAITKDILQLLLIPFRKFLSWGSRPAQYLEMDLNKKSEK